MRREYGNIHRMPAQQSQSYISRFAPSPSGPLHFGSLVAAMGSYLDAKTHQGVWLLRMEDIDPPREKPGAADDILRTLDAFGFEWDGSVLYQSQRTEAYRDALDQLNRDGRAYRCNCSRKLVAEQGQIGMEGPIYPGTCRNRPASQHEAHAIRFITEGPEINFTDRICGVQYQHIETAIGDFIIRRIDGLFAYQLAVVIDDAYQGITDIVRGSDLLSSTPRQILLQKRLNLPTPNYAHLPLVIGEDGKKLSKQSNAHPVDKTDPLPALLDAFSFLEQSKPLPDLGTIAEFWSYAIEQWDINRLIAD